MALESQKTPVKPIKKPSSACGAIGLASPIDEAIRVAAGVLDIAVFPSQGLSGSPVGQTEGCQGAVHSGDAGSMTGCQSLDASIPKAVEEIRHEKTRGS